MPFTITATNSIGDVSFSRGTPADALNKYLKLQQAGYQTIMVKDKKGREFTQDKLAHLSSSEKSR